ncbi:MAG: type II secretion system minor pseudopilin GspK [Gammaproteobacteria bacterium]|nr:type II secretion system minor pseudopilin GspK [Gammaproteobacteria bacterium]
MAVSSAGMSAARAQRGVALVTALLVVALATVAAVAMASRQQLDVRRTANLLQGDQAYVYAQAIEDWARVVLKRDAADNQIDKLDDDWAQRLSPITVPGGQVDGFIIDLQGRFNLNNLVNSDGQKSESDFNYFQNLLRTLELNDQLAAAVVDWIDADFDTRFEDGEGAEDDFYLSVEVPYRAANRQFQSISELRLVKGFDAAVWNKLAPYVCALPGARTALNVNTAAAPLLQALSESLTQRDAEQLVEERGTEGFESVDAFVQSEVFAGRPLTEEQKGNLAVASQFFLARSEVSVGSARARVFSVLQRGSNGALTLARTQGTW